MHKRWYYSLQVMLMVSACASPASISRNEEFDFRLRQLEGVSLSHSFFIDTDRCFIDLLMCKSKNKDDKKCWGVHETCVINVYHMHEQLKKK
jgi:hypothetical protein